MLLLERTSRDRCITTVELDHDEVGLRQRALELAEDVGRGPWRLAPDLYLGTLDEAIDGFRGAELLAATGGYSWAWYLARPQDVEPWGDDPLPEMVAAVLLRVELPDGREVWWAQRRLRCSDALRLELQAGAGRGRSTRSRGSRARSPAARLQGLTALRRSRRTGLALHDRPAARVPGEASPGTSIAGRWAPATAAGPAAGGRGRSVVCPEVGRPAAAGCPSALGPGRLHAG